jgi:adenylate cyclase
MNFYNDLAKLRIIFFITVLSGSFNLSGSKIADDPVISIREIQNIPYRSRLKLTVSTTEFNAKPVLYKFSITGKPEFSTPWSSSPEFELPYLKQGDYKLVIHSYCPSSLSSGEYTLPITIITPFYHRGWIAGLFTLLILSMLFILYKRFAYKYLRTPPSLASAPVSEMLTREAPKTEVFTAQVAPVPNDKSKWEKFEMATVLFSDIEGFTKIAEQMNPEKLIDELDQFFFHFDSVCEKYDIEKIKTIGDAYMAAGGIPKQNNTNPIEVVLAALEMQNYMKQLKNYKIDIWDLRIGIHSGPVIGGIIGHKKRSYDIWGDTVNTASRMESSGEPGKVNISSVTYSLIKDYFICEYRGKLPVKYKGNIEMYFVKGLRPELSINLGTLPNRIFFLKMQDLRLRDLEKFIFYKLESELSKNLYFHNINYIKHLYAHAGLLSRAENLTAEDTLLVKTTVLFLFTGLTFTYDNFLNKSSEFAEKILPEYKYNNTQINAVYNLILFAKLQHKPLTMGECIIHDLITEYYGRADYLQLYKLYFLEQNENLGNLKIPNWKDQQIKALKDHEFCTKSANRLREIPAETQILNIELDKWQ